MYTFLGGFRAYSQHIATAKLPPFYFSGSIPFLFELISVFSDYSFNFQVSYYSYFLPNLLFYFNLHVCMMFCHLNFLEFFFLWFFILILVSGIRKQTYISHRKNGGIPDFVLFGFLLYIGCSIHCIQARFFSDYVQYFAAYSKFHFHSHLSIVV